MRLNIFPIQSLKTKVTLTVLLIFVISIWTLSFFASQMLRRDMERLLGEQQFSTVSILADKINSELESRLNTLGEVSRLSVESNQLFWERQATHGQIPAFPKCFP